MRKLKVAGVLLACACLLLAAAPRAEAKEWRRVVPLRTTRAQAERRLGRPRAGYYELRAERAFIFYADGRACAAGGVWDVPRDTVVQIAVTPKTKVYLPSLRLDMDRFVKSADPEITAHALYTDKEAGITYKVFEGGKEDGLILNVQYNPTARDAERLRCPATR